MSVGVRGEGAGVEIDPPPSAPVAPSHVPGDGRRVYILARKVLLQNTRIFKQARSLTEAGYDVTLIGILPRGGLPAETRDGYAIIRLPLDPLYARIPRRIRRSARTLNRVLVRVPFRWAVRLMRWRVIPRRLVRRGRRQLRRLGLVTVARRLRVLRYELARRRRAVLAIFRRVIDADPGRRLRRLRLVRRLALARHALGRSGRPAPQAVPRAMWKRIALAPVALIARSARAVAGAPAAARRFSASRPAYSALRWFMWKEEHALRVLSEALVRASTRLLRPIAWPLKSIEYYKAVHRTATELPAPDVVHANDLDTLWIASRLARRHRVPLVYDAQELYTGLHTLPLWYRRMLAVQERFLIRRAQKTIVVNDAIRDVMEHRYGVEIDAVVLNCPPLEEDPGTNGGLNVRRLLGISEEVPVVLYSGALGPNRGLPATVLALEHLPDAHLVLLGEGSLRSELEDLAYEHGLTRRVFFADFVHHLDVPSFISSADVGVIPYENVGINHYLCSPSKLFHYIMAGLPVACSDFPFLRTVVLGNELGAVFDPADPRSIAAAVSRLVEPATRRACRERLAVARRRYCWEEQETLFMGIYDALPLPARSRR